MPTKLAYMPARRRIAAAEKAEAAAEKAAAARSAMADLPVVDELATLLKKTLAFGVRQILTCYTN